jgi:hypothetical protein
MKCFTPLCPKPALYTFHSGGLCIDHAAETRQFAPTVMLTAITEDDEPTDPNQLTAITEDDKPTDPNHYQPDARHETRPVGSDYPGEPGEPHE